MRALVPLALVVAAGAVFMFRPSVSSDVHPDTHAVQASDVRVTQEVVTPSTVPELSRGDRSTIVPAPRRTVHNRSAGKLARARAQQRSRSFFARLGKAIGIRVEHTGEEARSRQR